MKLSRMAGGLVIATLLMGTAPNSRAEEPPAGDQGGPLVSPRAQPEPPKADSAADLAAWAAEHKGDIEGFAGAKFTAEVPVKVATMDELAERIAHSLEGDMLGVNRPDGKPMTVTEIHIRAMAAAFKVATRTFGLYSREDKVVYVAPENVRAYAKKFGWSAETTMRAPRLAIAHEMVHALQDQTCNLGERLGRQTGEERAGLTAVSEGQAVWVTDQLAKKLDWAGANAVLWGLIAGVRDEEDSKAKAAVAPKMGVVPTAELYSLGKKFIEYQAAFDGEGPKGTERLWMILKDPPVTLEVLKDPAKFIVRKPPPMGNSPGAGAPRPSDKP